MEITRAEFSPFRSPPTPRLRLLVPQDAAGKRLSAKEKEKLGLAEKSNKAATWQDTGRGPKHSRQELFRAVCLFVAEIGGRVTSSLPPITNNVVRAEFPPDRLGEARTLLAQNGMLATHAGHVKWTANIAAATIAAP